MSVYQPRGGTYGGPPLDPKRCAESVYQPGRGRWGHSSQCSRAGVVEEVGHRWCRQHAPSAVAKRDAARRAQWARETAGHDHIAKVRTLRDLVVDTAIHYRDQLPEAVRLVVEKLRDLMGAKP